MTDQMIYRIVGISSLACIATFFFEFPFYLVRSPFPGLADSARLPAFVAGNATNIMSCIFLNSSS